MNYEKVSSVIRADFETGKLFWLVRPVSMFSDRAHTAERTCASWNTRHSGKEAFTHVDSEGYRRGVIYGQPFKAHRVVWLLATGKWPAEQIDHVNGDRTDNRLANLRAVSNAENRKNQKLLCTNTSGVNGVSWNKASRRWQARIGVKGKLIHLGLFDTQEAAVARRKLAEIEHGYHQNHGRLA